MDSIVDKLSEIESAAEAIVQHAEAQKPAIEKEMQAKRDTFDLAQEQETQEKLQAIRLELKEKMDCLLDEQRTKNQETIEALINDFEANHTKYVQKILKNITEV